jgi:hypothetical protein
MPKPHSYTFSKEVEGFTFRAPSKRKSKKYDAFDENGQYITSFGDKRYQHFFDRIGFYSHLNHLDVDRLDRYYKRHGVDFELRSPKFFSHAYLWSI